MRISDWSSDVCSSDLPQHVRGVVAVSPGWLSMTQKWPAEENAARLALQSALMAGAASFKGQTLWVYADGDRKSVVKGKSVAVSVGLGGRRNIKTKQEAYIISARD